MFLSLLTLSGRRLGRIGGFDDALHPTSYIEFTGDHRVNRLGGFDEIPENSIDGIFIKDSQVSVGKDVHLERFQFHTPLVRGIPNRNGPEIRQPSSWTNRGEFRDGYDDLIVSKLILKTLDLWKRGADP